MNILFSSGNKSGCLWLVPRSHTESGFLGSNLVIELYYIYIGKIFHHHERLKWMAKESLQIIIVAYYHFTSHLTFGQSVSVDQDERHIFRTSVLLCAKKCLTFINLSENGWNFCFCWKSILLRYRKNISREKLLALVTIKSGLII